MASIVSWQTNPFRDESGIPTPGRAASRLILYRTTAREASKANAGLRFSIPEEFGDRQDRIHLRHGPLRASPC